MKKFLITDYKKGLIFSLALHLGLLLVIFSNSQDKATPPQAQKLVTLSLNSFSLPQKVVEVQKPLQKPTEVVKPKPPVKKQKEVCKTKPLAKKHFKKEAPVKEEVTKEEVTKEEVVKEELVKETLEEETPLEEIVKEEHAQPVQESTQTLAQKNEPAKTTASLEEEFAQTNFEILRALILENLKYPHMAKRMNQTGIVKLMLVINSQGKLIDITLENSSGHKLLDKSALKAAKYLADLDLPVPKTTSRIVLPIAFSLN